MLPPVLGFDRCFWFRDGGREGGEAAREALSSDCAEGSVGGLGAGVGDPNLLCGRFVPAAM